MAALIEFSLHLTSVFEYDILPKRYRYFASTFADFKFSNVAEFEHVIVHGLAIFKKFRIWPFCLHQ